MALAFCNGSEYADSLSYLLYGPPPYRGGVCVFEPSVAPILGDF